MGCTPLPPEDLTQELDRGFALVLNGDSAEVPELVDALVDRIPCLTGRVPAREVASLDLLGVVAAYSAIGPGTDTDGFVGAARRTGATLDALPLDPSHPLREAWSRSPVLPLVRMQVPEHARALVDGRPAETAVLPGAGPVLLQLLDVEGTVHWSGLVEGPPSWAELPAFPRPGPAQPRLARSTLPWSAAAGGLALAAAGLGVWSSSRASALEDPGLTHASEVRALARDANRGAAGAWATGTAALICAVAAVVSLR